MTLTLSVRGILSTLPTLIATNDYRLSTIDYETENRPHAPGLPGGVMGGLFVRIFGGFPVLFGWWY